MRRLIVLVSASVLLALIGALALWIYFGSVAGWPRERFSAEAWKRSPTMERYRLVKDLQASGVLDDRSRAEVIALLGAPDSAAGDASYFTYVVKEIGPERLSFSSIYILQIDFDSRRRVSRNFLRSD